MSSKSEALHKRSQKERNLKSGRSEKARPQTNGVRNEGFGRKGE